MYDPAIAMMESDPSALAYKIIKKSRDIEYLIEESLDILSNHDSGINDLDYMLKLVNTNG